jgi:hypothetical protein
MLFLAAVPIVFTAFLWWRQRAFVQCHGLMIRQLTAFRRDIRAAGAAVPTFGSGTAVGLLLGHSVEQGHSLSAAIVQCIQWLRTDVIHAQKANRLRLLWFTRMTVVVAFAVAVRLLFCPGMSDVINGAGTADAGLVVAASTLLLAGSWLFCRLVPALKVDADGAISGLNEWLHHRICADNACAGASDPALSAIEAEEFRTGVSMRDEKVEVLNEMWRTRISSAEAGCETAGELMPVAEFFVFGVFLVSATCTPLLADFFG